MSGSNGDPVFPVVLNSSPACPLGRPVGCGELWCPGGWAQPAVSASGAPGASVCISKRSQAGRQLSARSLVVVRVLHPCVPLAECANKGSPWLNPSPSPHNCRLPVTMFLRRFPLPCVLPATLSLLHPTSCPRGRLRAGGETGRGGTTCPVTAPARPQLNSNSP